MVINIDKDISIDKVDILIYEIDMHIELERQLKSKLLYLRHKKVMALKIKLGKGVNEEIIQAFIKATQGNVRIVNITIDDNTPVKDVQKLLVKYSGKNALDILRAVQQQQAVGEI